MDLVSYEQYRETKSHGRAAFAYNTYLCTIPQDFARVPQHWHDEMEIICIKKGSGTVQVDLQPYAVEAGSLVFVAPGSLHAIDGVRGVRMEYENIIFSLSILDAKDDWCRTACFAPLQSGALHFPVLLQPGMAQYAQAAACIDRADEVCAAQPEGYPLFVKAQLFALLFALYTPDTPGMQMRAVPRASGKIKQVLRYVEQHYAETITVAQMSGLCCCSASHFMRFFKAAVGMPFVAYLNRYRLGMAARTLEETDCSVLEAAEGTGFENISYFNRCFKKQYGCTPRDYRKKG
ncbi:MAG: AraC family transcriptional regulator [Ruthenibacterium sp.]